MVNLEKTNGEKIIVNADEIEVIEYSYDTIINLKSGKKIIVKQTPEEVKEKIIEYRRACYSNPIEKKSN